MTALTERERFAAHGWNLASVEEACAELERLSEMARANFTERSVAVQQLARREEQLRTVARFADGHHADQDAAVLLHDLTVAIPELCAGHQWPCGMAGGAGDCEDGGCLPLPPAAASLAPPAGSRAP